MPTSEDGECVFFQESLATSDKSTRNQNPENRNPFRRANYTKSCRKGLGRICYFLCLNSEFVVHIRRNPQKATRMEFLPMILTQNRLKGYVSFRDRNKW